MAAEVVAVSWCSVFECLCVWCCKASVQSERGALAHSQHSLILPIKRVDLTFRWLFEVLPCWHIARSFSPDLQPSLAHTPHVACSFCCLPHNTLGLGFCVMFAIICTNVISNKRAFCYVLGIKKMHLAILTHIPVTLTLSCFKLLNQIKLFSVGSIIYLLVHFCCAVIG